MRLFVGVWPPPRIVQALATLPRPETPGLRWTTSEQWHVTLRFLGELDEAAAGEVVLLVGERLASTPPVAAHVGPGTGRFGRRVLHVPVSGLDGLAAVTVAASAGVGRPPEPRPFAGHITLARARRPRGVDLRPLAGAPVAGHWLVDEAVLAASRPGAGADGGARYDVVARLSLGRDP